jgi:phospholipase C
MKYPENSKGLFCHLALAGLVLTMHSSFALGQAQSGARKGKAGDISQIQHIVIIVKQNKSFDHYFGAFPGVDGATTGTLSNGQVINLVPLNDQMPDMCNIPACNTNDIDGGKMDRFDVPALGNVTGNIAAYSQATQADIPNYWAYAQNFVLGDAMFSSHQAAGFPNQLTYIAANTGGAFDNPTNPKKVFPVRWGCDSEATQSVSVFDAANNVTAQFPCFDFPTMADSLEAAGLTWKFYGPMITDLGYEWSPFDAINHIRNNPTEWSQVVSQSQFIADALSGNLPTVSWLIATGGNTEHPGILPGGPSVCDGENWTVAQINAIMQGPLWDSTAIFVTWDDTGGFFDHVAPPANVNNDKYTFGMRVPLLVVSPFAKAGYVSHVQYSHFSMLKFIETRFGLSPLTTLDGSSADMTDAFDFTQAPRDPVVLAPHSCPLYGGSHLSFGNQLVGTTSAPSGFTFSNRGTSSIHIASIATTGKFAQTNNCPPNLSPGKKCVISMTFSPDTTGPLSGQLTITDNDPSSPQTTSLTGTGSMITVAPPSLTFGTTGIGSTSPARNVTLTNHGTSAVGITGIQMAGDYGQTNTCGTSLDAGASCTISVTSSPTIPGETFGSVFINYSDPGAQSQVLMIAYGAQAGIAPLRISFPAQTVGTTSKPKAITIRNLGATALNFASIVAAGDFAVQSNTCGSSISPGGSCTVGVTFTPTAQGTRPGTITITDSDIRDPQVVTLSGTGQ